jgi:hypothetical protein
MKTQKTNNKTLKTLLLKKMAGGETNRKLDALFIGGSRRRIINDDDQSKPAIMSTNDATKPPKSETEAAETIAKPAPAVAVHERKQVEVSKQNTIKPAFSTTKPVKTAATEPLKLEIFGENMRMKEKESKRSPTAAGNSASNSDKHFGERNKSTEAVKRSKNTIIPDGKQFVKHGNADNSIATEPAEKDVVQKKRTNERDDEAMLKSGSAAKQDTLESPVSQQHTGDDSDGSAEPVRGTSERVAVNTQARNNDYSPYTTTSQDGGAKQGAFKTTTRPPGQLRPDDDHDKNTINVSNSINRARWTRKDAEHTTQEKHAQQAPKKCLYNRDDRRQLATYENGDNKYQEHSLKLNPIIASNATFIGECMEMRVFIQLFRVLINR